MSLWRGLRSAALGLAATLAAAGCSPDRQIVAEAERLHEEGNNPGALELLSRLAADSPDSPQLTEARILAVSYLTAEATEVEGEARRDILARIVDWEPGNTWARSALCRLELRLEQWDRAQACIDAGRGHLPSDRLIHFQELLTRRELELAEAELRKRLLESGRPGDLRALVNRYPQSNEAHHAQEQLVQLSLCEDLFRFSEPLRLSGSVSPLGWWPRLQETEDPESQLVVLGALRRQGEALERLGANQVAALHAHPLLPGEAPIRDRLVDAYQLLEPPLQQLAALFARPRYRMEERFAGVKAFHHALTQVRNELSSRTGGVADACRQLHELDQPTQAAPGQGVP